VGEADVTLGHKWGVRIGAGAWVALAAWWLQEERTAQTAVHLAFAVAAVLVSLRGLIVVQDDAVYRRGLFGWERRPVLLDQLTAVSLRREAQGRHIPLVLKLTASDGAELNLECWAWAGWRELAHRAGHFARALGAERDEVTERRMPCTRLACPWEAHATATVDGRPAVAPAGEPVPMGLLESIGTVAACFAFGVAFGLFNGWLRDDPAIGPLLPVALGFGGLFAGAGVLVLLWERMKGAS
jgi:hypothetical protein